MCFESGRIAVEAALFKASVTQARNSKLEAPIHQLTGAGFLAVGD